MLEFTTKKKPYRETGFAEDLNVYTFEDVTLSEEQHEQAKSGDEVNVRYQDESGKVVLYKGTYSHAEKSTQFRNGLVWSKVTLKEVMEIKMFV